MGFLIITGLWSNKDNLNPNGSLTLDGLTGSMSEARTFWYNIGAASP